MIRHTRPLTVLVALLLAGGCVSVSQDPAAPTTPGVRTFGNPPNDDASRTGTTSAVQSYTPPARAKREPAPLTPRWAATIGRTDRHTTMALAGGRVVVGSHGRSLDARDDGADGVYVLDARTGAVQRVIPTPGAGDRDVNGIALDGERVFFTTDNAQVVAGTLAGAIAWHVDVPKPVVAAPTLVDVDADGAVDVVAGDTAGNLFAFDGTSGRRLWTRATGVAPATGIGFESAVAAADVDGDGRPEIVAGGANGVVAAYRASDGEPLWRAQAPSSVRGAPAIVDLDDDGKPEVLAAWSAGTVSVLDGKTGRVLWTSRVEHDDGSDPGLLATPTPILGPRVGALLVPMAASGGGLVILGEHLRSFVSREGPIASEGVVATLDPQQGEDAIFGTLGGQVIAVDAVGGRALLATVGGPIEAAPMLADVDGDGAQELLVASNDGRLSCFATGAKQARMPRFRGASPHGTGVLAPVNLGWSFARNRDLGKKP